MTEENWISYWKKNLSDSLNSDIDLQRSEHFTVKNFDVNCETILSISNVERLINTQEKRLNNSKGITLPESENWIIIDQVQVLISPFSLKPIPEHQIVSGDDTIKQPFWYFAILSRSGKLSVPDEVYPVVQRRYLEPLADERISYVFSSMEKIDTSISLGLMTEERNKYKKYSEYIADINNIFHSIAKPNQNLINYKSEGHTTIFDAVVLLPNEEIGAAKAIVDLYFKILQQRKTNPHFNFNLLSKFIKLDNSSAKQGVEVPDFIQHNVTYLGQMGYDFPLSISQRKAIYTYYEKDQTVFAVNGPPGTGKTTLLQNFVANEMVLSAIEGNMPTIVLACSSNNQAVTNIIESFSKTNTRPGPLEGRWLPDFEGYATFLPRSSFTVQELRGINYNKLNGEGLFGRLESPEYIEAAKTSFIDKASVYFGLLLGTATIETLTEKLRKELIAIKEQMERIPTFWQKYLLAEGKFLDNYLNKNMNKEDYLKDNNLILGRFRQDIGDFQDQEKQVQLYFDHEPIFRKLFCFLNIKSAHESRTAQISLLLRESLIYEYEDYQKVNRGKVLKLLDQYIRIAKEIIRNAETWYNFKTANKISGNPPRTEEEYWEYEYRKIELEEGPNCFYDELDISMRHKSFQLALHYWEGRWISTSENSLPGNKGERDSKQRWLKHAMLTPCFVSTFYMAPKFFAFSKHMGLDDSGKNIWIDGALFNFIDLLLIDEAGQVPPEIGIATFSLAKRAIIVGDIKQIEPIWNLSRPIDLGNLKQSSLIKDYDDKTYNFKYEPKGVLSSSGSIMKMAQNSCDYQIRNLPERGVILLEHRRCYNEIINYCNRLAYMGVLKPLKGNSPRDHIFKPMILIPVSGNSIEKYNSRVNVSEVEAIAEWLVKNKAKIMNQYSEFEKSVGIITPFVSQKLLIKNKLKQLGYDTEALKIGTVHALQGAERPIILFSMVYGPNEVKTMFFDKGPNMLNVAVSRAKESFIVFANKEILNKNSNTPSGILANHICEC
jgi:hypothetical protein